MLYINLSFAFSHLVERILSRLFFYNDNPVLRLFDTLGMKSDNFPDPNSAAAEP
jgi:hypothetical protein